MIKYGAASLGLALIASAGIAQADGNGGDASSGWYVGIAAGYQLVTDIDKKDAEGDTVSIELDEGFTGRITAGYDYGLLRTDFRLSLAAHDLDKVGSGQEAFTGDGLFGTATINLGAEWENDSDFTPFVDFGLGAAAVEGEVTSNTGSRDREAAAAPLARLGLGVAYQITDGVAVTGDYDFGYVFAEPMDSDVDNFMTHGVNLGLRFSF